MSFIKNQIGKITSINSNGLGEVDNNPSIVLPFVLKGEEVLYAVHKMNKKFEYVLVEVLGKVDERREAGCEYFGRCGGCLMRQHGTQSYHAFKSMLIQKELTNHNLSTTINKIKSTGPSQRRRVNLKFSYKKPKLLFGFHRYNTDMIVNIDNCPEALELINNAIAPLKKMAIILSGESNKGEIFIISANNGLVVLFEMKNNIIISYMQKLELEKLAKKAKIIDLKITDQIITNFSYVKEKPYVSFNNVKVEVTAKTFLQPTNKSDDILNSIIKDYLCKYSDNAKKIIDLFCGVGTFSCSLAKDYEVSCYEIEDDAVGALKAAAEKDSLNLTVTKQDLYEKPINYEVLNGFDIAIINPPRQGAKNQIMQICKSNILLIFYVSCMPASFSRDAALLVGAGYQLKEITPVDQFEMTAHIELVAAFVK